MNSLKLLPPQQENGLTSVGKDTVYGSHDTFRHGFRSVRNEVIHGHPLAKSEPLWEETREKLKLEMYQRTFGSHMPLRLQMEKAICSQPRHIPALARPNVCLDVLKGDLDIGFEDFLGSPDMVNVPVHESMERALKMKI